MQAEGLQDYVNIVFFSVGFSGQRHARVVRVPIRSYISGAILLDSVYIYSVQVGSMKPPLKLS